MSRMDVSTIYCPKCGAGQPDYDGFGVVHCQGCGYCIHPARTGGVCEICGDVEAEEFTLLLANRSGIRLPQS